MNSSRNEGTCSSVAGYSLKSRPIKGLFKIGVFVFLLNPSSISSAYLGNLTRDKSYSILKFNNWY